MSSRRTPVPDSRRCPNLPHSTQHSVEKRIIGWLAAEQGREDLQAALEHLAVVERPLPLRNAIVHRFAPVSQQEVERRTEGVAVAELIGHMRALYQLLFNDPLGDEHPYKQINALCTRILDGER